MPQGKVVVSGCVGLAAQHLAGNWYDGGYAVLVEGYLDAISLHAHGVDSAAAVLGTALTPEQARLLADDIVNFLNEIGTDNRRVAIELSGIGTAAIQPVKAAGGV